MIKNPEDVREQHVVIPTELTLRETCRGKKSLLAGVEELKQGATIA